MEHKGGKKKKKAVGEGIVPKGHPRAVEIVPKIPISQNSFSTLLTEEWLEDARNALPANP